MKWFQSTTKFLANELGGQWQAHPNPDYKFDSTTSHHGMFHLPKEEDMISHFSAEFPTPIGMKLIAALEKHGVSIETIGGNSMTIELTPSHVDTLREAVRKRGKSEPTIADSILDPQMRPAPSAWRGR
ncbi:MAG: hypothetical protein J0M34_09435 [Alphaproteobacteria bacterium]|nr:hypothetical protein [Alphaproteobacteria bacterium]